jgi:hypothetical protein
MENYAMAAKPSIDPARFLHDQLESASPDLLRSLLTTFVDALMSAEADAVCGAACSAAPYTKLPSGRGYLPRGRRQPFPPRHLADARGDTATPRMAARLDLVRNPDI